MSRPSYLFRMFPEDLARLDALSPRFGGKREVLAAALRALEHLEAERQAESMEAKATVLARIEGIEVRLAQIERTLGGKEGRAKSPRRR